MKVLITGVAGFVGGYLAEHLLARGDNVCGVSSKGHWSATSPTTLADRVPLLRWDIAEELSAATREAIFHFGAEAIYHLAALSIPADCGYEQPTAKAQAVNIEGTRRVVELCRELRPSPRLLFVSSSHVYAAVTAENYRVSEDAPVAPTSGYGHSKLAGEQIVLNAVRDDYLDAIVARSFQHTGPRQGQRMMLPQWAAQFARGENPVRVQRPNALIDLCDVRDVVRAYAVLVDRGLPGSIYNVGSGNRVRSGDVMAELRRIADPGRSIAEQSSEPKQDPIAIIEKIRSQTGWSNQIDWRQTVADTWHYWSNRFQTKVLNP